MDSTAGTVTPPLMVRLNEESTISRPTREEGEKAGWGPSLRLIVRGSEVEAKMFLAKAICQIERCNGANLEVIAIAESSQMFIQRVLHHALVLPYIEAGASQLS